MAEDFLPIRRLLVLGLAFWTSSQVAANEPIEIYVSPLGSDSTGDGTTVRPYETLQRAMTVASPGDNVVLRGGVYRHARQVISSRGTVNEPIIVSPYAGETVVFDARGLDVGPDAAVIELVGSAHVTLRGLEVRNSSGRGIALKEVEHVEVSGCVVHDIDYRAIGGHGRDIRFIDNEVYRAALVNAGGGSPGGWPGAISTWTPPGEALTRNVTIRGNRVYEIWGEGIIALLMEDSVIEGNIVHDTFGSAIYVDTSRRVTINANHVWMADLRYRRTDRLATGVNIAAECCHPWGTLLPEDILIMNNLFSGTGRGIHFWHDRSNRNKTNSYRNVDVFNNVFFANAEAALSFDSTPWRRLSPRDSEVRNNVIYSSLNGITVDIPQPDAWSFSHNDWPDGMPLAARGPGSLTLEPGFARAPTVDGATDGFKLLRGSPLEAAAIYDERVSVDMWGTPRPRSPAIGLFEPLRRRAN